jgi:hypothetical protein
LARGEVINAGNSVDTALKNFKWGKQAMGCVVLRLLADNRRPIAGEFVVRGELEAKEWRLEAAKLWPEAEEQATLVIKTPKADIFSFPEGGLWSEIVEGRRRFGRYRKEGSKSRSPWRTTANGG